MKIILIVLGTFSLFIGLLGIFIPGLPTTPFLLITAGLYIRSSEKLYHKIINNKYFGSYIQEYQSNKGMSIKTKIFSICLMWIMIVIACLYFISTFWFILSVSILGLIGTIVMGFMIPTINNGQK